MQPAVYFGIYQFPGAERFAYARLLQVANYVQQEPYSQIDIQKARDSLLAFLHRNGYFEAEVNPEVEDGLSLTAVRARIKKLQESVAVLKRVPIPAPDIRQKVQSYVRGLTRPIIGGVDAGEVLTVRWPTELHVLMAFLQPEVRMAEINRIANTPCALPEREQRIAEERTEEAIVVVTGAARERGCPAWVVLGVKAEEVRGARAA